VSLNSLLHSCSTRKKLVIDETCTFLACDDLSHIIIPLLDARDSEEMQEDDEEVIDTISSRFVEFLLTHLLKGITVKDKAVRLRCCQIIALSINSLGEIE
jgi:hypothetical protein